MQIRPCKDDAVERITLAKPWLGLEKKKNKNICLILIGSKAVYRIRFCAKQ